MVGSRQAEHELHKESIEEDDIVMRIGSSLIRRQTNKESKEGCRPKELIKRC